MTAVVNWLAQFLGGIWAAFLKLISSIVQWGADLLSALLGFIIKLFFGFLTFAAGLLPQVPDLPTSGPLPALVSQSDYFVPLSTAVTCLGIVGLFWVGNYLYKLAKFIRGGG